MEYKPSFRDDLHVDIQPSFMHSFRDKHNAKMMYGLPKVKKFPMPDAKHVRSAIRFFNYAKPSQERELANAILARMADYGIGPNDINVGDDNRFKKYLQHSYLAHHGIKGMHWGVRKYQNPDGSYTALGKKRRSEGMSTSNEKLSRVDMKYDRLAKKDAKEFARAKMSTGEGAGNRRKLIKATVEQRRKQNAHYNDVFDSYLDKQDMSKHAKAARRERATKDTVQKTRRAVNTTTRVLNTAGRFLPYIM